MIKQPPENSSDLFRLDLSNHLDLRHSLCRMRQAIDWSSLESSLSLKFASGTSKAGCPSLSPRLMIAIIMLQSLYGVGDTEVVERWVENPYWQYFCGYDYLQWEFPCDPSSLTRWRGYLGAEGLDKILSATIDLGIKSGCVKRNSFKSVVVDSTVMPKNITHPTDSKLLQRAIMKLSAASKSCGVKLRQSYVRVSQRALNQAGRYGHAKQFKRMQREVRKLKTYLGRLVRDVERKMISLDSSEKLDEILNIANRLLKQQKNSKNKIYFVHEPDVACIAKGKARAPYEFGAKTSLVVTHKEGFACSIDALKGNPHDSKTLASSLTHSEEITGVTVKEGFVDRGYRGHGIEDKKIYISGQKRGLTAALRRKLKRRQMIEPYIGHMKRSHRLQRNYLKGRVGDQINATMAAIGHNMAMIIRYIELLLNFLLRKFYLV